MFIKTFSSSNEIGSSWKFQPDVQLYVVWNSPIRGFRRVERTSSSLHWEKKKKSFLFEMSQKNYQKHLWLILKSKEESMTLEWRVAWISLKLHQTHHSEPFQTSPHCAIPFWSQRSIWSPSTCDMSGCQAAAFVSNILSSGLHKATGGFASPMNLYCLWIGPLVRTTRDLNRKIISSVLDVFTIIVSFWCLVVIFTSNIIWFYFVIYRCSVHTSYIYFWTFSESPQGQTARSFSP